MSVESMIGSVEPPSLHIMTFNVRRRMPVIGPPIGPRSADRWDGRAPAVAELLAAERPHVLGAQEVMPDQDRFLSQTLGSGYRRLGHGRDANGQGEGCPLYIDSTRLDCLDWDQAALSDTPSTPGSRSWGNFTPRVLVRAVLLDRVTGHRFLMINTHFDHISRRSRVRSAEAIRLLVEAEGLPAIVTGDLNTGEDTAPLAELFSEGTLADAWGAARSRLTAEWGTFPNYREPRRDRKRIDWIAVTGSVDVDRIGVNTSRPGGVWPSDHLPVQAVVRLPDAPKPPDAAKPPDAPKPPGAAKPPDAPKPPGAARAPEAE